MTNNKLPQVGKGYQNRFYDLIIQVSSIGEATNGRPTVYYEKVRFGRDYIPLSLFWENFKELPDQQPTKEPKMEVKTRGGFTWEGIYVKTDKNGDITLKDAECISDEKPEREDLQGILEFIRLSPEPEEPTKEIRKNRITAQVGISEKVEEAKEELEKVILSMDESKDCYSYDLTRVIEASQNLLNALEEQKEETKLKSKEERFNNVKKRMESDWATPEPEEEFLPEGDIDGKVSVDGAFKNLIYYLDTIKKNNSWKEEEIWNSTLSYRINKFRIKVKHLDDALIDSLEEQFDFFGFKENKEESNNHQISESPKTKACDDSSNNKDHDSSNKSIWKPISDLPELNCNLLLRWVETKEVSMGKGYGDEHGGIVFDEFKNNVKELSEIKEYCTLTDFVNQQEALAKNQKVILAEIEKLKKK